MDTAPQAAPIAAKTSPRDFFLWAGALLALYGSVVSLIALLFSYVNRAFPDPLAYAGDPFGSDVRFSMAVLIVLAPLALVLFRFIRKTIAAEAGKAHIWVRRWALMLTLFIAGATIAIDLITLINTFLGGEITVRFFLKVAVVLLVASAVFMHFLADLKGYWLTHGRRANLVGIASGVLALLVLAAGFVIVGSPTEVRMLRYDAQKVSDLQNIQWQIVNYWQQKGALPVALEDVADPLSGSVLPMDPQSGEAYVYEATGELAFTLCATFNRPTPDTSGQGAFPARDMAYPSMMGDESFEHGEGETCFDRTIDPERYPPFDRSLR